MGKQGMKDTTGLFWAVLGAGSAGMQGQCAEELLPVDALPHSLAAALCQGLLACPLLWGAPGWLWCLSGASPSG